jgi:hypothetical protein
MPTLNKRNAVLLALLLPLLMVSGCAHKSSNTPPPVVGEKPKALPLPSSIAGIEPPPSGFYTEKLMARRKNSQELLRSTLMKSAP